MKESGKMRLKQAIYESTRAPLTRSPFPDGESKLVAATPRSVAQVVAVLAFVISHMTFLSAQDDETGRCPKVCDGGFPSYRQPSPRGEGAPKGRIGHWRHERSVRYESLMSSSLLVSSLPVTRDSSSPPSSLQQRFRC